MVEICLVYRSGKKFDATDVRVITKALRQYGRFDGTVKCLTDRPREVEDCVEPVDLIHPEWPDWWSKIERYRPGLFQDAVLYFDLDTVIFDSIHPLTQLVETSYQPMSLESRKHPGKLATGINSWRADQMADIYDAFREAPDQYISEHKMMPLGARGPQGFVRRMIDPPKLQHYLPEGFIQFRRDFVKTENPVCSIVAWSGKPVIRKSEDPGIAQYWEEMSR